MISNCSRKKSPGFDLITANVANCLPNKAFILLTYIYNAILRLSYFPTLWKFSQIIMVAKPDKPPDLPKSYRPISLLLYFSKICERLILKRIYPHIISKNVLLSSQFGFRAKHSTVHQVHRAIGAISTSLENKCYCTCAFLDISQAFDKVWHEGLLFKLRKFLPTTLFLLMESYLTDRHFQIRQGSATSNIATISAGVPQGGVLSPILFNIYAADQPSTQNTIVADYADDKVILSVHNDPIIASRNLQSHLNLLSKCNDNTNNWQTVPIKSPTTPTSPNPIIQKTNSFSSKNRFSALATNEISYEISNEVEMLSQEISNVQPKIPPIFIKDDIDFFDFCKKIKPFTDPDGFNTKSSSSGLKLMTYSINAYRQIIKFLEINNMNFHTYQTNEEKAFRVVIRHLHHTTPTDYIKEELRSLGFITRSITNCLQYKTKNPLPLFFVDLEPSPSNHNIYKVESICYTKIKIEAPHPKKNPVQRLRCQNYGHTRTYCHHTPRCPLVPSALGITQHHTKAVPNSNCSRKDDLQSKPTGQPKPKTPPQLQSKPTPFKKILSPTLSTPMEHLSIYHNTKPLQRVRTLVRQDRRLTVRMLADELNLKRETVRKILTDDLSMKKLCANMVPKNLLAEQKHVQMSISQDCLEQVEADPTLLDRVITGDESWYFQYDPETKRQSQQWLSPGAARPKKARMSKSNLRSSSNEYVCDPSRPCTSNEQYLDTNDTLVISGMSNVVCDSALVEKTVINADKNETHNNKCKYYRYIGDFLEEDLETPRRRKLFWNTHTKILDEKNQKKRLLEQKNRRLESKISSLNTLVDELKKECQLNASYSYILKNIGTEEEKQLLMRQIQISTGKSICPILRKFAMTLHFYSPSAYSYVRTIFSKALPDVSTIRKWYSKLDGLPGMTKE
ncbi:hypothetical protein QTP88_010001 [Uroleucon formosanum]